jgi:hypothetical protein
MGTDAQATEAEAAAVREAEEPCEGQSSECRGSAAAGEFGEQEWGWEAIGAAVITAADMVLDRAAFPSAMKVRSLGVSHVARAMVLCRPEGPADLTEWAHPDLMEQWTCCVEFLADAFNDRAPHFNRAKFLKACRA